MADSQPISKQSCALAGYPWADGYMKCSSLFIICNWCNVKVCRNHSFRITNGIPQLNACTKCIALNAYYVHKGMKIYVRKQCEFSEKIICQLEEIYSPIIKPCRSHD